MTVQIQGDSSKEQVWIFGFGSLIWKAGRKVKHHYYPKAMPLNKFTSVSEGIRFAQGLNTANGLKATSRTTGESSTKDLRIIEAPLRHQAEW